MYECGLIRHWLSPVYSKQQELNFAKLRAKLMHMNKDNVRWQPSTVSPANQQSTTLAADGETDTGDNRLGIDAAAVDNKDAQPLKVSHFQGAFILLAIGYVLGLIALSDELCVSARQRDEEQKQKRTEKMKAMADKRAKELAMRHL